MNKEFILDNEEEAETLAHNLNKLPNLYRFDDYQLLFVVENINPSDDFRMDYGFRVVGIFYKKGEVYYE